MVCRLSKPVLTAARFARAGVVGTALLLRARVRSVFLAQQPTKRGKKIKLFHSLPFLGHRIREQDMLPPREKNAERLCSSTRPPKGCPPAPCPAAAPSTGRNAHLPASSTRLTCERLCPANRHSFIRFSLVAFVRGRTWWQGSWPKTARNKFSTAARSCRTICTSRWAAWMPGPPVWKPLSTRASDRDRRCPLGSRMFFFGGGGGGRLAFRVNGVYVCV